VSEHASKRVHWRAEIEVASDEVATLVLEPALDQWNLQAEMSQRQGQTTGGL